MDPRITVLTLGCTNVARTAAFYETLGWTRSAPASKGDLVYFVLGTLGLALFPHEALAREIGISPPPATPGTNLRSSTLLSHNVRTEAEVHTTLNAAQAAGGRILREASLASWGGTRGYFADPEGHIWEVCFNPKWALRADGSLEFPTG